MSERYETIEIVVKTPEEGESWFDRIHDILTGNCNGDEEEECTCGVISMGGSSGTLDQCYDHMRFSEKWAQDVLADDLKEILGNIDIGQLTDSEFESYERLRKAAFYHDDFQKWLDSIPDEEEE